MDLHPVVTSVALGPLEAANKQGIVPRFISPFNKHPFLYSIVVGDNLYQFWKLTG